MLSLKEISTPIAPLMALADDSALYLLVFITNKQLAQHIDLISRHLGKPVVRKQPSQILTQLEQELIDYFSGESAEFRTPCACIGSSFQKTVWSTLQVIPFGKTSSYTSVAERIHSSHSARAVAQACAANRHALLIPCHRVIRSDGTLSGYNGGHKCKEWLLTHEAKGNHGRNS